MLTYAWNRVYFDVKKYHVNQFVAKGNKVELAMQKFSIHRVARFTQDGFSS
jgi:hypothetical protein